MSLALQSFGRALSRCVLHVILAWFAATLFWSGTAKAQTLTGVLYQVSPVLNAQQCLDVAGPSTTPGAALQIYDCGALTPTSNQVWSLQPFTLGGTVVYQFVSQYSKQCLDVDGVSVMNGAGLQQWTCGGITSTNQLWQLRSHGGTYELVSVNSQKCLDLPGGNTTHGTRLQQWDCAYGSNPNQLWVLRAQAATPSVGIPSTLFGMTVLNFTQNIPLVTFGSTRTFDSYPNLDWGDMNPARGVYNFTSFDQFVALNRARGADILYTFGRTPVWASSQPAATAPDGTGQCAPPANMQDWDNFVLALAQHNAGIVKNWEIWNEPQYSYCGSMATLVTMAQHAHDIIKSVDSTAVIVGPAGTTSGGPAMLSSFLAAGGAPTIDVVAFHGYPYGADGSDEAVQSVILSYQQVMQVYGITSKPLWNTETSWLGAWSDSSFPRRAGFVAKCYLLSWSSGVSRVFWYSYEDPYWGGIWDKTLGLHQDGVAYQQVSNWMIGTTMTQACAVGVRGTWTCSLTRPSGYKAQVVWNSFSADTYTVPAGMTQYRDLAGVVHAISAGSTYIPQDLPVIFESGVAQ